MISRDGDLIIFECDGKRCPEAFESETYIWEDAVARLKEAGWKIIQVGSQWLHHCPSCHEDWLANRKHWLTDLAKKLNGGS